VFYEQALEMLAQINGARDMLRSKRAAAQTSIDLAVPHTLSLTFMPNG
jgi:DNA-binding transcriptional LysR family regulator